MNYEQHPIGACYPPLTKEANEKLRALVRTSHDAMPPAIIFDGKILDGWHYYKVCLEEGASPKLEAPEIADPYVFVTRRHEGRRHLTTGQRAVVAERMATLKHGGDRKSSDGIRRLISEKLTGDAARLNKVGTTSVREARYVKENGIPEIYQALEHGKIKPYRAKDIAGLPKAEQAEALKAELAGDKKAGNRKRGVHSPSRSKRDKETPSDRAERFHQMLNNGRKPSGMGLSREEVDPDFKGSSREWIDTYGHVQIMTKEQLAADRADAALMNRIRALNNLRVPIQKYLETQPFDPQEVQAWIKRSPERRLRKLGEMLSLITQLKESFEPLLSLLTKEVKS